METPGLRRKRRAGRFRGPAAELRLQAVGLLMRLTGASKAQVAMISTPPRSPVGGRFHCSPVLSAWLPVEAQELGYQDYGSISFVLVLVLLLSRSASRFGQGLDGLVAARVEKSPETLCLQRQSCGNLCSISQRRFQLLYKPFSFVIMGGSRSNTTNWGIGLQLFMGYHLEQHSGWAPPVFQ